MSFIARPLQDELVGEARTPLLLLFGAVGMVLFIACANVAGLLLAQSTSRRDEFAVRTALGARRGRIIRQLVTESLRLGLVGGLLGVGIAYWVTSIVVSARPEGLPRPDAIQVDGMALTFAFGASVLSSALAGLVPAIRSSGVALAGTLRTAGRGRASQSRQGLRRGLVVAELAIAVVVLVGASLLIQSFVRLSSIELGFQTEHILSFRLELPRGSYRTPNAVRDFYQRFIERVQAEARVSSAGSVYRLPVSLGRFSSVFRVDGSAVAPGEEPSIGIQAVSSGYFKTMGIGVLRGRGISDIDGAGATATVVINDAAARRFFPGQDPIGRRLVVFGYDPVEAASDAFTIVGVVADVRNVGLTNVPEPEAYFSHAQVPLDRMYVVVRTIGDSLAVLSQIHHDLAALDANIPMPEVRTIEQVVASRLARPRFFTTILTLFSTVALLLAAIGIFGLLSFAVAQRTHEIGLRIALGASSSALVGTIAREAVALLAIGLGIGTAGALALTRMLQGQLYGVSPTEPIAFLGVTLVLGLTVLTASLVPAWRAARVDPLVALRSE